MSARDIPAVKACLRGARLDVLQALARRALECEDVAGVRALERAAVKAAA